MTTGVVTSVSPHNGSGTLTADVAIGATVLPLDDAEPFAEDFTEPRYLVIGAESTSREYVATVNDESGQESVTLAVALDVAFEAGMPVTPWDPTVVADDKRGVTHAVWVRLDGQDGTIRATVPHEFIPLSGVEALIGASVGLDEDAMSGWMVEQVYGREATVDPAYIDVPVARFTLANSQILSNGIPSFLFEWDVLERREGISDPAFGGFVTIDTPGLYMVIFSARFRNDPNGNRQLQITQVGGDPLVTVAVLGETMVAAASDGSTLPQLVAFAKVTTPMIIRPVARQTSGGSLEVLNNGPEDTHMEIVRIG